MMKNKKQDRFKPFLQTTLSFFKSQLTEVNDKRLQLNRGKGLAKYFAKSQKNIRDITPLDTTLGVMSFSLYFLRFSTNIGLLAQLIMDRDENTSHNMQRRDLFYSLANDSLWSLVNLTQFFWLTYRKSIAAGLHGMQLETLAQFIDLLVMIFRYQQDKEEYDKKYRQATGSERAHLVIEWQHKQLNFLRGLLTSLSIMLMFGLFSFSIATVPLSPIISALVLISSLIRVFMNIEKDKKLLNELKLNGASSQQIMNEKREMTNAHLKDLNQLILSCVFIPIGLFLLLTTPIPVTIIVCLTMVLLHSLVNHLIKMDIFHPNCKLLQEKATQNEPEQDLVDNRTTLGKLNLSSMESMLNNEIHEGDNDDSRYTGRL